MTNVSLTPLTLPRYQQQQPLPSQEHQRQQSQQGSQLSQIRPGNKQVAACLGERVGEGKASAANSVLDDPSEVDCFDW